MGGDFREQSAELVPVRRIQAPDSALLPHPSPGSRDPPVGCELPGPREHMPHGKKVHVCLVTEVALLSQEGSGLL